jgi:hypothetical protein
MKVNSLHAVQSSSWIYITSFNSLPPVLFLLVTAVIAPITAQISNSEHPLPKDLRVSTYNLQSRSATSSNPPSPINQPKMKLSLFLYTAFVSLAVATPTFLPIFNGHFNGIGLVPVPKLRPGMISRW